MIKFHLKPLNEKIGVYLLYVKNELAYVGRSSNLRSRLNHHFNPSNSEYQEWKSLIDVIEYYLCESLADSDIIETYLINTLHPTFNKDKVYLGGVTIKLELPEKYEIEKIERDSLKELSSLSAYNLLQEYCKLITDKNNLEPEYILNRKKILEQAAYLSISSFNIKEVLEKLGKERVKASGFNITKIQYEIDDFDKKDKVKTAVMKEIDKEKFYSCKDIKILLGYIYTRLGIRATAKASDILEYCDAKLCCRKINDKSVKGYQIVI